MLKQLRSKLWEIKETRKKRIQAPKLFPDLTKEIIDYFFKNYDWVASLSLLNNLASINRTYRPLLTVEFGCGITTLVLARTMQPNQYLITIDESLPFLHQTAQRIKSCHNITFINPTSDHEPLNFKFLIDNHIPAEPADLLIIDGPTGQRFSDDAKRLYARVVTSNTICVIDDTDRAASEEGALWLCKLKDLTKTDITDPLFRNQTYTVLFPKSSH